MKHDKEWMDIKFIRINHRALDEGLFSKLKGSTLKVLQIRMLLADDFGRCNFPTYWVAKKAGLTIGTALKAEKELESFGWFSFDRQRKGKKRKRLKNGRWAKNSCRINFDNLPFYLRGLFRTEDREWANTKQNIIGKDGERIAGETVSENSVTEKLTTISLRDDNSYSKFSKLSNNNFKKIKPINEDQKAALEAWEELEADKPENRWMYLRIVEKGMKADELEYLKNRTLSFGLQPGFFIKEAKKSLGLKKL